MKKIIYNLRQRSEETRRHILHIVTLIMAVFLFIIWIYTLGTGINDKETKTQIKNDLKPFSALKDNFINGYKSITDNSLNIFE